MSRVPASHPRGMARRGPGASPVPRNDPDAANDIGTEPGTPGRSHHEKPGFGDPRASRRERRRCPRDRRDRTNVLPRPPTQKPRKTGRTCCHAIRPAEDSDRFGAVSASEPAFPRRSGLPPSRSEEMLRRASLRHPVRSRVPPNRFSVRFTHVSRHGWQFENRRLHGRRLE